MNHNDTALTIEAFELAKAALREQPVIQPTYDLLPPPEFFDVGDVIIGAHAVWRVELVDGRKEWQLAKGAEW